MGIPGLTLYHLKSHLQKYRLSKNLQSQANASRAQGVLGCSTTEIDKPCEGNGSPASHLDLETQTNSSMHINEALQMQIEVQRRLHEQLEVYIKIFQLFLDGIYVTMHSNSLVSPNK
jgi:hypothetical protein